MEIPSSAYETVFESDVEDSVCDLSKVFEDIRVLPSDSSSLSVQLIVRLDVQKAPLYFHTYLQRRRAQGKPAALFIKVLPNLFNVYDNRLFVEMHMYRYLKTYLLLAKVTPNIMEYIAVAKCTDLVSQLEPAIPDIVPRIATWIDQFYGSDDLLETLETMGNTGYLLMVEAGQGDSFYNMLVQHRLPRSEILPLLFQIGYTLYQMHLVYVRHNDMHLGNIWIDVESTPRTLIYRIDSNHIYRFTTRYIAKIFDFDLSTWTSQDQIDTLSNFIVDDVMCPRYGLCSTPDSRYDWFTVLSSLHRLEMNREYPELEVMVEESILDDTLLDNQLCCHYRNRYCMKMSYEGESVCNPRGRIPPEAMRNFRQLVHETDVFDQYSITHAQSRLYTQNVYTSVNYNS